MAFIHHTEEEQKRFWELMNRFENEEEAIKNGTDIKSITQIVEMTGQREMVNDTDKGAELRTQIKDLQDLLLAYQKGILKEK